MNTFSIRTRADSEMMKKAAVSIEASAWNALGFLNFTSAHFKYYDQILDEYADHQLCLVDNSHGYPIAAATCAPIACGSLDQLPAEGWDWIVESAGIKRGGKPNFLGGLSISVPKVHRSKGLARVMIKAMGELAKERGYDGVVLPVRPTAKAKHPEIRIDDYITWTDEHGRSYDPWFRSHLAAGGKMVRPCRRSMVVEEPIAFWETWTGQTYTESGAYVFEGGLTPIAIDTEAGVGRYEEPNVWFAYLN